ncbi:MAG: class I tRNA ligase family protein, partial [Bacteroidetes bacterium]|nr:class I tRNA ligase family protein [Bacteroidota bacterium]
KIPPSGGLRGAVDLGGASAFPADFIAEGVDQTRGWFFTLHTIAGMLFNSVAFKNVLVNGLVLDKEGNKMSKRIGNVVDPFEIIKTYGPDATRWYMMENAPPWENLKFDANGIAEIQRRFFGTLHNTYSFFALYANLDHFTYPLLREKRKVIPVSQRSESDKWVISKLNSLILVVENALSDYEPTKAVRAIQDFVIDDLSNWYVRLNRKRYWKTEQSDDKTAAYQTLYECLETVARLASPIAPFYMEQLFLDLQSKIHSVHLTDFPEADHKAIDHKLEKKMRLAQQISSLIHSLRKKHNIKVRQPLTRILIPVLNKKTRQHIQSFQQLILSEVNVKNIEYIDDSSGFMVKKIKPDYKRLGKQYGPKMKLLAAAINNMRQEDIAQLERDGNYVIKLNRKKITLTLEDVEISFDDIPGWSVAGVEGITVALDINITDELRQEGIARELVNRIQNLRKDMGFEVQDKINIRVEKNSTSMINAAIELHKEYICKETLALSFDFSKISDGKAINIDGHELVIKLEKNATKTRRHKESQR